MLSCMGRTWVVGKLCCSGSFAEHTLMNTWALLAHEADTRVQPQFVARKLCCETGLLGSGDCGRWSDADPCHAVWLPNRWTIPANLLQGYEKVHTFTVVVSKGTGSAARSAKSSISIRPRDPTVPIPTGVLTRDCGGACSARHSGTQPPSVSLKLNQQNTANGANKQVNVEWLLNGKTFIIPDSAQSVSAAQTTPVQVIILPDALPQAAAVTISVTLTISGQQGSGEASLTVPINAPPVLKSALEASLLGEDNSFGKAAYRVSAAGIVDDDELT